MEDTLPSVVPDDTLPRDPDATLSRVSDDSHATPSLDHSTSHKSILRLVSVTPFYMALKQLVLGPNLCLSPLLNLYDHPHSTGAMVGNDLPGDQFLNLKSNGLI